jgi:hypothetical protein
LRRAAHALEIGRRGLRSLDSADDSHLRGRHGGSRSARRTGAEEAQEDEQQPGSRALEPSVHARTT